MRILMLTAVVCAATPPARAGEAIDALYDAVAPELAAGKPLAVEVQVALCDNTIIACGGRGLGDGDDVLETVVYEQRVRPAGAWLRRGLRAPFVVRVVAHAWRGRAIDSALDRFVADLFDERDGAARVVAYVGHNGWMDRETLTWPTSRAARVKGFVAIACLTRDYLERALASPAHVPLLLTRDLLFAGSHSLDGAVTAFAHGGTAAEVRLGASRAYADGEHKPLARVQTLFTN